MEKFINIAESILNLWNYEDYQIGKLDIRLDDSLNEYVAFVTYHSDLVNQAFDVKIYADGTFKQI